MFDIRYKGIPIKTATHKAYLELGQLSMDFFDVKEILEEGFDCAESKRRKDIEEKCIRRKKKVIKVVVEKMVSRHGNEYWRIRHAGIFTFKEKRFGGVK